MTTENHPPVMAAAWHFSYQFFHGTETGSLWNILEGRIIRPSLADEGKNPCLPRWRFRWCSFTEKDVGRDGAWWHDRFGEGREGISTQWWRWVGTREWGRVWVERKGATSPAWSLWYLCCNWGTVWGHTGVVVEDRGGSFWRKTCDFFVTKQGSCLQLVLETTCQHHTMASGSGTKGLVHMKPDKKWLVRSDLAFLIGDASSNAWFPIVMLVFRGVIALVV